MVCLCLCVCFVFVCVFCVCVCVCVCETSVQLCKSLVIMNIFAKHQLLHVEQSEMKHQGAISNRTLN